MLSRRQSKRRLALSEAFFLFILVVLFTDTTMASFFSSCPLAPPNSILGLALECRHDPFADKIDLTIGAYRSETGKPVVLDVVREAEEKLLSQNLDHEYLGQDGLPTFNKVTQILMFGEDSPAIKENRIFTIQGLSGTGSLRLAFDFVKATMSGRACYYPEVTWPNHPAILESVGIEAHTYRYVDSSGCRLDYAGFIEDLTNIPEGSLVVFHACAHNPTGVDPTKEQWREILEIVKAHKLLTVFDNAYQGFVSGDPIEDAYSVRLFVEAGLEMIVACSFAKNFGLYGERAGALHMVLGSPEEIPKVASQLRVCSRVLYSTCPSYGARIVATILEDPISRRKWELQCGEMARRLNGVRQAFYDALIKYNLKGKWDHVIEQKGMFSYSGIPADVVARLKAEYHIYMLGNGRISLAGLNMGNVDRFARALVDIMGTN